MRVSTSQIYSSGLDSIQRQQAEVSRVQQQLASGKRILTPSDDPGGAVQALQFKESMARLEQYSRNGGMAELRLRQEEAVLGQVIDGMQRVRELAIQGNNATQTPETRRAIATEVRQQLDQLYNLANTRDANGEYMFAGIASLDRPFSPTAAGAVYNGSAQTRDIALSDIQRVRLGDSGADVFMGIVEGNGRFVATESAANTGSGVVQETSVPSPALWDGAPRTLRFTASDAWEVTAVQLDAAGNPVLDAGGNPVEVVTATGSYAPGETLVFEGLSMRLSGAPAAGDTFEVRPAENQDMFAIYSALADALEQPASNGADQALQAGAIGRVLADLDQAGSRISDVRSTVGARLNTIEAQGTQRETEMLEMNRTLSEIEDLDYAEAISRFNLRMVGLEAAQQSYTMLARLTLFDFMR